MLIAVILHNCGIVYRNKICDDSRETKPQNISDKSAAKCVW
jgi:hypothetical protein